MVRATGIQALFLFMTTGAFRGWLQSIEVVKNSGIGKRYLGDTIWFYVGLANMTTNSTAEIQEVHKAGE